jgi:hypothetical protein
MGGGVGIEVDYVWLMLLNDYLSISKQQLVTSPNSYLGKRPMKH